MDDRLLLGLIILRHQEREDARQRDRYPDEPWAHYLTDAAILLGKVSILLRLLLRSGIVAPCVRVLKLLFLLCCDLCWFGVLRPLFRSVWRHKSAFKYQRLLLLR